MCLSSGIISSDFGAVAMSRGADLRGSIGAHGGLVHPQVIHALHVREVRGLRAAAPVQASVAGAAVAGLSLVREQLRARFLRRALAIPDGRHRVEVLIATAIDETGRG